MTVNKPGWALSISACLVLVTGLGSAAADSRSPLDAVSAASAETAGDSVWITIGDDAYDVARRLFPAGISGDPLPRVDVVTGVVLTRIPRSEIPLLSERIHTELKRCGGFVTHESEAEARVELDRIRAPQPLGAVLPFTIDQPQAVAQLVGAVDESQLLSTLTTLSTSFPNRYHAHHATHRSADWIRDLWAGYAAGRPEVTVELIDHGGITPQPSVVLTIPGRTLPDELVILGGHQDTIRSGCSSNPNCVAPGADDDGSGIASLSELIRAALATGFVPDRTVQFVGYAAEEVGLDGSGDLAGRYMIAGTNVVAVLQLDMTAYQGSSEDIVLITDFTNAELTDFVGQLLDTYFPSLVWSTGTCGYACSDHASWSTRGFRAAFPFESRLGQSNPAIHTSDDTLAGFGSSAAHAMKFTRLAAAFLAETALAAPQILFADGFESGGVGTWSASAP